VVVAVFLTDNKQVAAAIMVRAAQAAAQLAQPLAQTERLTQAAARAVVMETLAQKAQAVQVLLLSVTQTLLI
jgi:hypothetical protein